MSLINNDSTLKTFEVSIESYPTLKDAKIQQPVLLLFLHDHRNLSLNPC